MIVGNSRGGKRSGAALVEASLVLLPLLMFVFGIFTYGMLLMDMNILNNAAREGCRYALANNTNAAVSTNVTNVVNTFMAGRNANFTGFTITLSGSHQGTSTAVANLQPGDLITVKVSGTYALISSPLLYVPSTISLSSAVTMICEGGT